jgi:hypothetical protein
MMMMMMASRTGSRAQESSCIMCVYTCFMPCIEDISWLITLDQKEASCTECVGVRFRHMWRHPTTYLSLAQCVSVVGGWCLIPLLWFPSFWVQMPEAADMHDAWQESVYPMHCVCVCVCLCLGRKTSPVCRSDLIHPSIRGRRNVCFLPCMRSLQSSGERVKVVEQFPVKQSIFERKKGISIPPVTTRTMRGTSIGSKLQLAVTLAIRDETWVRKKPMQSWQANAASEPGLYRYI